MTVFSCLEPPCVPGILNFGGTGDLWDTDSGGENIWRPIFGFNWEPVFPTHSPWTDTRIPQVKLYRYCFRVKKKNTHIFYVCFLLSFLYFSVWTYENVFICVWPNSRLNFSGMRLSSHVDTASVRACRIFQVENGVSIETLLDEKCPAGPPLYAWSKWNRTGNWLC